MRVQSNKPCAGDSGGWLHPVGGEIRPLPVRREEPIRPTVDAESLMRRWHAQTTADEFDVLAGQLGVATFALRALKCGWSPEHQAWAFPMRDGSLRVCGIRLRYPDGRKLTVTGTHNGIFAPEQKIERTAWVVEGPTDTAALLTLGKCVFGRPSCSGGIAHLSAIFARLRIQRAVLVADNDEDKERPNGQRWNPGIDGAKVLADEIGIPCCLVVLPSKDSREFLRFGGTAELLDSFTQSVVWQQPKNNRSITHAANLNRFVLRKNFASSKNLQPDAQPFQ